MFAESSDEFTNVNADDFDLHSICPANLVGYARLFPSLFDQLENSGSHNVDRKHLTLTDIEEDSSVLRLCAPHCVEGIWHFGLPR
jgi:hypothetical protein